MEVIKNFQSLELLGKGPNTPSVGVMYHLTKHYMERHLFTSVYSALHFITSVTFVCHTPPCCLRICFLFSNICTDVTSVLM
jgi:hypothetical protein